MTYERRESKWQWRSYLTAEEKKILKRAETAKSAWLNLNRERAAITNRAIQRAKYAAKTSAPRGDDYCRIVFSENVKGNGGLLP